MFYWQRQTVWIFKKIFQEYSFFYVFFLNVKETNLKKPLQRHISVAVCVSKKHIWFQT